MRRADPREPQSTVPLVGVGPIEARGPAGFVQAVVLQPEGVEEARRALDDGAAQRALISYIEATRSMG